MAAQRDPLLHFSAAAAAAAVNTLLLRTGQGYPKIAQEGREEGGPTDRQTGSAETTAVMKQTSSWRRVCENKAGPGSSLRANVPEIRPSYPGRGLVNSVLLPRECDMTATDRPTLRSVQCNRVRSFPTSTAMRKRGRFVGNGNGPSNGPFLGRRPKGFLGLSLNDRTILFRVILLDKTVSDR